MNKKINQLSVRTAVGTDLALVGDPTTGTSYKTTFAELPLVPYTGATGAVNLGAYDLTVNNLTVGRGLGAYINNTVFGSQAGAAFTTAQTNVAIGEQTLKVHSTGNANTAVGRYAMLNDVDGAFNTALGSSALVFLATGVNTGNTVIGVNGLGRLTSGSYNTWLGYTSAPIGILTSGSFNTILGAQVNVGVATLNNNIILADGQGNIRFRDDATSTILSRLAGTGLRMVTASTNGELSTQTIPNLSSGGSSVAYYLNGGTAASVGTYYQMSKTAVLGTAADFNLVGNGLIAQFLTDVSDPNRLEIPAGNWNFEMYFNISSVGGNTAYYVELLKYNGTTFTSIASNVGTPEEITGGTSIDLYLTSLAIPQTTLLATDRLALRVYIVNNSGGRTVTLHTQDSHLCEIITNFAGGVSALNGLTANTQYYATGTSGTNFAIVSSGDTHTFNLPTASATNRGALSSADWTTFNNKQAALTLTTTGTSGAATLVGSTLNIPQYSGGGGGSMAIGGAITSATAGSVLFAGVGGILQQDNANLFWDDTNNRLGIGTTTPSLNIEIKNTINAPTGFGIINLNTGTSAQAQSTFQSDAGYLFFGKRSTTYTPFKIVGSSDGFIYNTGGDLSFYNETNRIKFSAGSSATSQLTIFTNGNVGVGTNLTDAGYRLDVNGTARVSGSTTFGTLGTGTGMFWDNTNNILKVAARGASISAITTNSGGDFTISGASSTSRLFITGGGWTADATSNGTAYIRLDGTSSGLFEFGFGDASTFTLYSNNASTNIYTQRFKVLGNGNIAFGNISSPTAQADISASTTARASLRIRSGTAPTTPNDGDIWFDGTDLKMRVSGVTKTFTLI